jgi:hypothetical protein
MIAAPADVPATVVPAALRLRIFWAMPVPPRIVESRNWLPPVRKIPVQHLQIARVVAIGPLADRQKINRGRAKITEDPVVVLASGFQLGCCRDNHDIGVATSAKLDKSTVDLPLLDTILTTADGDDETAILIGRYLGWAHEVFGFPFVGPCQASQDAGNPNFPDPSYVSVLISLVDVLGFSKSLCQCRRHRVGTDARTELNLCCLRIRRNRARPGETASGKLL